MIDGTSDELRNNLVPHKLALLAVIVASHPGGNSNFFHIFLTKKLRLWNCKSYLRARIQQICLLEIDDAPILFDIMF